MMFLAEYYSINSRSNALSGIGLDDGLTWCVAAYLTECVPSFFFGSGVPVRLFTSFVPSVHRTPGSDATPSRTHTVTDTHCFPFLFQALGTHEYSGGLISCIISWLTAAAVGDFDPSAGPS
jgi:hypothetical protein